MLFFTKYIRIQGGLQRLISKEGLIRRVSIPKQVALLVKREDGDSLAKETWVRLY